MTEQRVPGGATPQVPMLDELAALERALDAQLHGLAEEDLSRLLLASRQLSAELTALNERVGAITAILARRRDMSWSAFIASAAPDRHAPDGPEWAALAAPKLLRALINASAVAGQAGRESVTPQDLWDGMLAVREGSAATIVSVLLGDRVARDAVRRAEAGHGGRVPAWVPGPDHVSGPSAAIRPLSEAALSMLDASVQVAQGWGHGFVGTEHLMLAMVDADPTLWPERAQLSVARGPLVAELIAMLSAIGLEVPDHDQQEGERP